VFSGTLRTRDRLELRPDGDQKVTAIRVFERGSVVERPTVSAGQIAQLWGLAGVRIGDGIGAARRLARGHEFAPPTLETVVVPVNPRDAAALHGALGQLAEQDPLIDVGQDDALHETSISLYGEVQKEVIQATLAADFGLQVAFRETTTIFVERPIGHGQATELLGSESNPFVATVGLRVGPAAPGAGVTFELQVEPRALPLYVYKTPERFVASMARYVQETLAEGLLGWRVTDCAVTMVASDYAAPSTTAADFRKLTPLVLMRALAEAGTVVCEPMLRVRLETPTAALGAVLPGLVKLGGAGETPVHLGDLSVVEAVVPATRLQELRRELPGLTGGEGVLESEFAGYEPVAGEPPARRRTRPNPLNREEYLLLLARRVPATR
jgi:ribosomal protection tetracycline resistance protein